MECGRHQHPRQPCGGGCEEGKKRAYDPADQALGRSRGGFGSKIHLVVEGHGIPLAATITAGQAHESKHAAATLEQVCLPNGKGRPQCRPKKLAGDKAYSHPTVRAYLRRRGILPVIPTRKNQRANPRFDRTTYRKRNVIERCVGWLKENRRLATRHAKLATNYLATVKLAMIRRRLHLLRQARYCSSAEERELQVRQAGTTGRLSGYGSSSKTREGQ